MAFSLIIQDDSLPNWLTSSSVYLPKHYSMNVAGGDGALEFIDVVETWRDITPQRAHVLRGWQHAFREALTTCMEMVLKGVFQQAGFEVVNKRNKEALRGMHACISELGYQSIQIDLEQLITIMIDHIERAPCDYSRSWLRHQRRTALANYLRLQHSFTVDPPLMTAYFYSELTPTHTRLKIFARLMTHPHLFSMTHSARGDQVEFRDSILSDCYGIYPTSITPITPASPGASKLTIATMFPEGGRFERLYRFRYRPSPSETARKYRKRGLASAGVMAARVHPRLREVSQNSVRVQGTSDYEQAMRENHPGLMEAYQDYAVGKAMLLEKVVWPRQQEQTPSGGNAWRFDVGCEKAPELEMVGLADCTKAGDSRLDVRATGGEHDKGFRAATGSGSSGGRQGKERASEDAEELSEIEMSSFGSARVISEGSSSSFVIDV